MQIFQASLPPAGQRGLSFGLAVVLFRERSHQGSLFSFACGGFTRPLAARRPGGHAIDQVSRFQPQLVERLAVPRRQSHIVALLIPPAVMRAGPGSVKT